MLRGVKIPDPDRSRWGKRGALCSIWVARVTSCIALILVGGCTSIEEAGETSDRARYLDEWWNFYERGLQRQAVGEHALAREDFERCLGIRPGAVFENATDRWRVRTYGMHMMEGYFPNRELGISLYHLRAYDKAVRQLEASLSQEPSGRAKFYMNRSRKQLLRWPVRRTPFGAD